MGEYVNAVPTVGSTQSIFDVIRTDAFYLEDNVLKKYDGIYQQDVVVPGTGYVVPGLNWGGTAMPVFFRDDRRVRNCRMLVAMQNQARDIPQRVRAAERMFKVVFQWMPEEKLYPVLDRVAAGMTPTTPPRENRQVHRSIDWCTGRGNNVTARLLSQKFAAAIGDEFVKLAVSQSPHEILVVFQPARSQQTIEQRPRTGVLRWIHGHHVLVKRKL